MPSPEIEQLSNSILSFEDVKDNIPVVQLGDTVTGFPDLVDLDRFTANLLAQRVHGYTGTSYFSRIEEAGLQENNGRVAIRHWNHINKLPSVALQPKLPKGKQFIGRFVDISTTLIDETIPKNEYGFTDLDQLSQVIILLSANLYSTGRGIIGRSSKLLTVYEAGHINRRKVTYTELVDDNADLAAEFLLAESESNSRLVAVMGLRNAILAGLPSLGKR